MTEQTEKLLEEVLALPTEEQADFFDQFSVLYLGNHHGFASPEIADEWGAEIARRLDDVDSGKVKTIPWEEVRRKMNAASGDRHEDAPSGPQGGFWKDSLTILDESESHLEDFREYME